MENLKKQWNLNDWFPGLVKSWKSLEMSKVMETWQMIKNGILAQHEMRFSWYNILMYTWWALCMSKDGYWKRSWNFLILSWKNHGISLFYRGKVMEFPYFILEKSWNFLILSWKSRGISLFYCGKVMEFPYFIMEKSWNFLILSWKSHGISLFHHGKVIEFPYSIMEKSWNLKVQKEHKPRIYYHSLPSYDISKKIGASVLAKFWPQWPVWVLIFVEWLMNIHLKDCVED